MSARRFTRRGAALIATIWVLIALAAMVLVFAQSMRVEAIASANRLSEAQADATERGAEQFLTAVVDTEVATPGSTAGFSMEARRIGSGYFWVIARDPNNDGNLIYYMTDEASKLDLNTASLQMLDMLPNIPQDVASSIYNWRGVAVAPDGLGAEDSDYQALPDPYLCKHSPFETTDELSLVLGATDDVLFEYDLNRNGILDPQEQQSGGLAAALNQATDPGVGILPFLTPYGVRATNAPADSAGPRLIDVNSPNTTALQNLLSTQLSSGRAQQILQLTRTTTTTVINGHTIVRVSPVTFLNIFDFAARVNLTSGEFSKIITRITANPAPRVGKINVNTAPREVLMCLPGLEQSDADAIVAYRQTVTSSFGDISWLLNVLPHDKLAAIGNWVTGTSTCYSADIVAISADGRAFKRYRIVLDGRQTPANIIYRRDLTSFGWPLDPAIRTTLQAGQPLNVPQSTNGGAFSL